MTRLPTRVWATLQRHRLLVEGDRVLVAVSGGVDSVVLLHVLAALAPRARARLAGVVHVHHGLRGEAADQDAGFCEQLATALGLPFDLLHVEVAAEAARRRWSIERTGHALRHAAYRLAARRRLATRIALGHTLDDQAETVILRLLRGAGTRGLAGMWPSQGLLIRPLLDVRRADVEHYAAQRGLSWREDASNRDLGIPRNAVRHVVLPALVDVAGPSLPERLARQADAWRDDEQWLAACVAGELPSVLTPHADGGWLIDLPRLHEVPPLLRRRVRRAILEQLLPRGQVSLAVVDGLERLESLPAGRAARLRSLRVTRDGSGLRVRLGGPSPDATPKRLAEASWAVPGSLELEGGGWRLEASVLRREAWKTDARPSADDEGMHAALDAARVGSLLMVRARRPGDRLRPLGLQGSQKLQDLFVNRKIPRSDRDLVPVVTTAHGQIAWVVGLAVGEEFAIQPHTTAVLLLHATRSGGKA